MSLPAEPPLPGPGPAGTACHACDAPLAADQRYCLVCGARRGAGGPIDFAELLGSRAAAVAPAAPWSTLRGARAPVAATMLATLLLTGILLGSLGPPDASGGAAQRIAIASHPPPVTAVVPTPAPAPTIPIVPVPPVAPVQPAASSDGAATTDAGDEGTTTGDDTSATDDDRAPDDAQSPAIKHVFVIMLADQSQPSAFGARGGAPFLSETLVPDGTLLPDLHTISSSGLANSIALLSGQGPNAQTAAGCPTYADVAPGTIGKDGQEQGAGCVYSVQTPTLANQLEQADLTWRAYLEDQGDGGPGVAATCRHPELGTPDPWRDARPGDAYATARNPFVYFHAITDARSCAKRVVGLDELDADLALASDKAPTLSYIVPNLCNDGRATPCAAGALAGPGAADAFLAEIVPKIRASRAYEELLLVVTFERPAQTPTVAPGPAAYPAIPKAARRGGKVGALFLSPFVRRGRTIEGHRDTYSLLATIARILSLEPLGAAARPDARPFGASLLDSGSGRDSTPAQHRRSHGRARGASWAPLGYG